MTHFKLRAIVEQGFLESKCWNWWVVHFKALPVSIQCWSNEHRVFVIETFFKSGDSVVRTQHLFRQHFDIGSAQEVDYAMGPALQSNSICKQTISPLVDHVWFAPWTTLQE